MYRDPYRRISPSEFTSPLQGLTTNIGKRESAYRDLETMGKVLNLKKQSEAEEMQAQALEQQAYERIEAQANELLSGDAAKIKERSIAMQREIREKIRSFGGSRKAFIKNGGASILADYSRNLTSSSEFLTFKENKANMTKILQLKEAGKGHLINARDHAALMAYNENGEGTISYSGVLNEIDVTANAYAHGQEIGPEDVLKEGANRAKIIENYMTDLGSETIPTEKQLIDYIKYKGYGGIGTNVQILQYRDNKKKAAAKAAADKAKAAKKQKGESKKYEVIGTMAEIFNRRQPIAANQIDNGNVFAENTLLKTVMGTSKYEDTTTKVNTFLGIDGLNPDDHYRPKGAFQIAKGNAQKYFSKTTESFQDENGLIGKQAFASKKIYGASGGEIDLSDMDEGNYTIKAIIGAYETSTENGGQGTKKQIVMDKVDGAGKVVDSELYQGNSIPKMYQIITNEEGQEYYVEIPFDSSLEKQNFVEDIGVDFDKLAELGTSMKKEAEKFDHLKDTDFSRANIMTGENMPKRSDWSPGQKKRFVNYYSGTKNSPVFESDAYKLELNSLSAEGRDRDALIRSFYIANTFELNEKNEGSENPIDFLDEATTNLTFSSAITPEIEAMMRNKDVNGMEIIDAIFKENFDIKSDKLSVEIDRLSYWTDIYKATLLNQELK